MLASFAGAIEDIGRNRDWDNDENYVKVRYRASLSKNRVTAHGCDLRTGVDTGQSRVLRSEHDAPAVSPATSRFEF